MRESCARDAALLMAAIDSGDCDEFMHAVTTCMQPSQRHYPLVKEGLRLPFGLLPWVLGAKAIEQMRPGGAWCADEAGARAEPPALRMIKALARWSEAHRAPAAAKVWIQVDTVLRATPGTVIGAREHDVALLLLALLASWSGHQVPGMRRRLLPLASSPGVKVPVLAYFIVHRPEGAATGTLPPAWREQVVRPLLVRAIGCWDVDPNEISTTALVHGHEAWLCGPVLHIAVRRREARLAAELMQLGARPDLCDVYGQSAADLAVVCGMEFLRSVGPGAASDLPSLGTAVAAGGA